MIISLDTETTGVDLAHGAMPFIVTWCEVGMDPSLVEWDVDPLTRLPNVDPLDVAYVAELLDAADTIYLHNAKFDARALAKVGIDLPWHKVRDTLVAGHLLATNHPHNLTDMCVEYLGVDIEQHEKDVEASTKLARTVARRDYPTWLLADEGVPGMPSVKGGSKRDEDKPWKNDMWLPRALRRAGCSQYVPQHWSEVAARYACADSEHTLYLGRETDRLVRERGLWAIYEHKLRVQRVACEMEVYGVTARGDYTDATVCEYERHVSEAEAELVAIAAGYGHRLELAQGAALNDNMREFFYGSWTESCTRCKYVHRVKHWNGQWSNGVDMCPKCAGRKRDPHQVRLVTARRGNLKLDVAIGKKSGNATLDRDAMDDYLATLDEGPALDFVGLLTDKRMYDTALQYMHSYRRFWVPVPGNPGFYRIHPSLNPCGTDHLRWASNSPNLQNVSGESKELSNRACFGPLPNREWWNMDFRSIERRIPAYESGEPKMVEVFERPDEPPYWGSLYYLTASVLYPDEFWPLIGTKDGFKRGQPRLYKQAKFCDLAKQYGCGARKYDSLSRISGSFNMVDSAFPMLSALQAKYLALAERTGWVETLPDRTVDPARGYPILASRTEDGRVLSTTPFNYHTSGTACWCKNTALVRCADQCRRWRAEGFDAHIPLEVHDSILFDFPRGKTVTDNMFRALILKDLMEQSGEDLVPRIPTPVSVEYITESWANGAGV